MAFLLLMPSYNQARYIADAVRSALQQDDPDWELWIVDNSTDRTPEVMRAFDDPRIRFHHIPERMDPGSCLNWMLARAKGEHFSYVHTDNNLHPSYVRRLRRALSGHELGLAYCDMRVIDAAGNPKRLFRRGAFDLARLLSLDVLGVPFAATTELARRVGGFSVDNIADDVLFCCSAYGFADYIHVPDPLLDYRLHDESRTEHTGGTTGMQAGFLGMFRKLRPILERRGLQPLDVLADAIEREFDELDWYFESRWYRDVGRSIEPWWNGRPRAEHFFSAGLLKLPGFSKQEGKPPIAARIPRSSGRSIGRFDLMRVRNRLRSHRRHVKNRLARAKNFLLPWAVMALGAATGAPQRFRVQSLDFRTVWAARELERSLGWTPQLDASLEAPSWLRWGIADATDPVLDCRARPLFSS